MRRPLKRAQPLEIALLIGDGPRTLGLPEHLGEPLEHGVLGGVGGVGGGGGRWGGGGGAGGGGAGRVVARAGLAAASSEVLEETGYSAAAWQLVLRAHLSNSVSDEEAFCYLATGRCPGTACPEEPERLQVRWVPFASIGAGAPRSGPRPPQTARRAPGVHPGRLLIPGLAMAFVLAGVTNWLISDVTPDWMYIQRSAIRRAKESSFKNLGRGRTEFELGDFYLKAGVYKDSQDPKSYIDASLVEEVSGKKIETAQK